MGTVIGSGLIANRFIDYAVQSNNVVLFAGSVHDSTAQDFSTTVAEEAALKKAISEQGNSTLVYFSSCSVLDSSVAETLYVKHKLRMEKMIEETSAKYIIFRLPQIIGLSDSKSSLIMFLVDSILNGKSFDLWKNAKKNLIDIDHVHEIVGEVLKRGVFFNKTMNVAAPNSSSMLQIVNQVESFLGKTAIYQTLDKGSSFDIDAADANAIAGDLKIKFEANYLTNALDKYFSHLIRAPKLISVIVPTYNEEHGIEEFYRRTKAVLKILEPRFLHEIIFVNDFSKDNTLAKLYELADMDTSVKVINFSRNFGNQMGITAGIDYSKGDISVVIDDDLQDPPEIILNLIGKWSEGYKVVYGLRPNRQGVNPLFKLMAKLYYRLIGSLSDTQIPKDTGDFRLIDRVVIETLKSMREENRYYRGMVAWVGFSQFGVLYERDKRFAGVSTFSFKKYVNFALNGLTSFTDRPLYFSSLAGVIITSVSFILALILVVSKILDPKISIRGWTSLTVMILFFGGIQLLSMGVLGIYISKIYREVKGRPLYIVENTKNIQSLEDA
jgi:polyisoprenyl-phosphate glycosyltransferase